MKCQQKWHESHLGRNFRGRERFSMLSSPTSDSKSTCENEASWGGRGRGGNVGSGSLGSNTKHEEHESWVGNTSSLHFPTEIWGSFVPGAYPPWYSLVHKGPRLVPIKVRGEWAGSVLGVKRKQDSSLSSNTHSASFFQRFPPLKCSEKTTQFPKVSALGTSNSCLLCFHLLPYPVGGKMPLGLMAIALSSRAASLT